MFLLEAEDGLFLASAKDKSPEAEQGECCRLGNNDGGDRWIDFVSADLVGRVVFDWDGQAAETMVCKQTAIDLELVNNFEDPAREVGILGVILIGKW